MITNMIINNIANTNTKNLSMMNGRTLMSGTITTISVLTRKKKRSSQVRQKIIQRQKSSQMRNQKRKYQKLTPENLLIVILMLRRLPSVFSKLMNLELYGKLALDSLES